MNRNLTETTIPESMDTAAPAGNYSASVATLTPDAVAARYGSEVSPNGPRQDMSVADILAGTPQDRTASPSTFTGGDTGTGAGGNAIGQEPGRSDTNAGVTVQRGAHTGL